MVPEEWLTVKLSDITKEKISYGIVQAGPHVDAGVPYIKSSDVKNKIDVDNLQCTSNEIHYKYRRSSVHPGDIVFSLRGNIGECAIVPETLAEANLTQGTARISVDENHHNLFVYYQLRSNQILNRINALSKGSTFKEISLEQLRKVEISTPPIDEQIKIARILSTWDEAIEATEKLIANSKVQKAVLMRQLLTGKSRFPGYKDGWSEYRLKEIANILVSNVDKKTHGDEHPVSLCNYTDVYYNDYITNDLPFMLASAKQREISKFTLQKGDVLITKDSESPDDIAISALVREALSGVLCGYHLAIVRPKQTVANGGFLNFLFSLQSVRNYFSSLANGATRFGLTIGSIENAIFKIPKLDEQVKIASLLMAQDDEISNLKSQRRFLARQKQALMQQLLSGKRRVKLDSTYLVMHR